MAWQGTPLASLGQAGFGLARLGEARKPTGRAGLGSVGRRRGEARKPTGGGLVGLGREDGRFVSAGRPSAFAVVLDADVEGYILA